MAVDLNKDEKAWLERQKYTESNEPKVLNYDEYLKKVPGLVKVDKFIYRLAGLFNYD